MTHEDFIKITLNVAKSARNRGNHPFGAILVAGDEIICRSENTVVSDQDVTQHAELRLVSEAYKLFGRSRLRNCTLYTSTEPCAMCAGAIYWSGIRTVVFGLPAADLGAMTTGSFVVNARTIFDYGSERVDLLGPIALSESRKVHDRFW